MRSIFIFTFLFIASFFCLHAEESTILVSVSPHKYFVERIAGDTVKVQVLVPTGASSHTFEPTPKLMISASKASIWFMVGEGFEPRLRDALKSHHPDMLFVNMREGVDMITASEGSCHCCHDANMQDMHIWLSPREVKAQARTIAQTLEQKYPAHRDLYQKNLEAFIVELDALDADIRHSLSNKSTNVIMVMHPAYAYFVRDYGLEQLSIESEGKDPTPKQMTSIIEKARRAHVKKIFIQPQYSSKGARLIAAQIGAEVVELDPYSEDYMNSMRAIGQQFGS